MCDEVTKRMHGDVLTVNRSSQIYSKTRQSHNAQCNRRLIIGIQQLHCISRCKFAIIHVVLKILLATVCRVVAHVLPNQIAKVAASLLLLDVSKSLR